VPLGPEACLVIGGYTENFITKEKKLIFEAEIIDTKARKSYFPVSKWRLPDDTT